MPSKHTLIRGAFILTAAGFISRFMGFFFRIFLSHAFGEENVGLYQLIFPVYALCHSIGTAGIETALSRTVARKISLNRYREAKAALFAALFFTVSVSLLEIILIQQNADAIAVSFLGDQRFTEMLVIISYALPCSAVHCCICGYSFGLQKTEVPAISQLVEQTVRILFVIGVFFYISGSGGRPSISLAAAGVVAGEFFSLLYSARILSKILRIPGRFSLAGLKKPAGELMRLSLPLTANRTAVTLLQSVEAASIPASLKLFGMDTSDALSTYGVLTGMALPCILFPSAVTSSVGTVLMPAVTKAQADGDPAGMAALIRKAASGCFLLGLACCLFFLLSGSFLGEFLFQFFRRKIHPDPGLDVSVSLYKCGSDQLDQRAWENHFHISDQHAESRHADHKRVSGYPALRDPWIPLGASRKPGCCNRTRVSGFISNREKNF